MGRIYSIPFASGTVTNAGGNADLWEIVPADDKPVHIVGMRLGQTSEVADAAEEGVNISIIRLPATFTSGNGSSVTPVAINDGDAAAAFAAETNGATVATTSGTAVTIEELAWNIRNSPCEIWYPDSRFAPTARQAAGLVVRLNTTVADDITFAGTLWVEED
jgi:hypothetical protein